jgi:hypothetical protein
MAVLTQAQLAASSSAVYTTNNANQITAAIIRPFNDNWISSSVLIPMTSSMSVGFAATASFLIGGAGNAFPYSGSAVITGSFQMSGSAVSQFVPITVASNTASIDCRAGNLFGVTLGSSATTFFNFTNILEGQTGNVIVSAASAASASFSTNVKQISGSAYRASSGAGQTDLLSFVTQGGSVFIVNSKKFV